MYAARKFVSARPGTEARARQEAPICAYAHSCRPDGGFRGMPTRRAGDNTVRSRGYDNVLIWVRNVIKQRPRPECTPSRAMLLAGHPPTTDNTVETFVCYRGDCWFQGRYRALERTRYNCRLHKRKRGNPCRCVRISVQGDSRSFSPCRRWCLPPHHPWQDL